MVNLDPMSLRVLTFLADRYQPVMSEWVETPEIAAGLSVPLTEVDDCCRSLTGPGLVELSLPDAENPHAAALITVKGLLAIGRVP